MRDHAHKVRWHFLINCFGVKSQECIFTLKIDGGHNHDQNLHRDQESYEY